MKTYKIEKNKDGWELLLFKDKKLVDSTFFYDRELAVVAGKYFVNLKTKNDL